MDLEKSLAFDEEFEFEETSDNFENLFNNTNESNSPEDNIEVKQEEPSSLEQELDKEEEVFDEPQIEVPVKKVQTPEENARFAEQRRQSVIDQRVKEELDRLKSDSLEFKTTQLLAQMYNVTPEQLYKQIEDARLKQEADKQGIPIEVAKSLEQYKNELGSYQQKLQQLEFQSWASRVDAQEAQLKQNYPMLTDDDLHSSKVYLLETIRNPDMPLEQAVFALHGAKITNTFKDNIRNEVLAEMAGRKKGSLPPQSNSKASPPKTLSQDEILAARALGISQEDYLQYKF
jgi:rRNA-processing protein FCF1